MTHGKISVFLYGSIAEFGSFPPFLYGPCQPKPLFLVSYSILAGVPASLPVGFLGGASRVFRFRRVPSWKRRLCYPSIVKIRFGLHEQGFSNTDCAVFRVGFCTIVLPTLPFPCVLKSGCVCAPYHSAGTARDFRWWLYMPVTCDCGLEGCTSKGIESGMCYVLRGPRLRPFSLDCCPCSSSTRSLPGRLVMRRWD